MIIGCGIDLVEISRVKDLIEKWNGKFINKVYTEMEMNYCENKNINRYQSYAGFFAAKEAFVKAMGTGFRNIQWRDIEIITNSLGKPIIYLSDRCASFYKKVEIKYIHLSISHTKNLAIAQVIIESY